MSIRMASTIHLLMLPSWFVSPRDGKLSRGLIAEISVAVHKEPII